MAGWCGELLSSPEATVRTVLAASVGSLSPSVAERASACISRLPPADGVEVICALHGAALRFAEALEAACAGGAAAEPAKLSEEQLAAIFRGFVALQRPSPFEAAPQGPAVAGRRLRWVSHLML